MDISAPLKPAALHILRALADKASHGYGVMVAVREQSGGRVPLQTGSFYRHLSKLIDAGLVDEAPRARNADDPRRGAYYRLTPLGRKVAAAEIARLEAIVEMARDKKLVPRPRSL